MDHDSLESAPPPVSSPSLLDRRPEPPWTQIVHRLYTTNPFYAVSAALVFAGLRISFAPQHGAANPWALAGGLTGYTLLLALSAFLLVRYGKVWDDARTMLLLVVLSLFAISLSFEEMLIGDPATALGVLLIGFGLTIGVSEFLLVGLGIRLSWMFRGPYYLLMALFFLYPALIASLELPFGTPELYWLLFGFPVVAGVLLLSLVPASAIGSRLVRDNGTPWGWPLFPWILFGLLGLCAAGRSWLLCMTFEIAAFDEIIFAPYFLVPLWLAGCALVMIAGIRERRNTLVHVAMLAALLAVLISLFDPADHLGFRFRLEFIRQLAGPWFLSLALVAGLYALAAVYRVPRAADALTLAILTLSFMAPKASHLRFRIWEATAEQIALAAAIQFLLLFTRRSSLRGVVAYLLMALAVGVKTRDTMYADYHFSAAVHGLAIVVMLLGWMMRDEFAHFLRRAIPPMLATLAIVSLWNHDWPFLRASDGMRFGYRSGCLVVTLVLGFLLRQASYFAAALAIVAAWLTHDGWDTYEYWKRRVEGLHYLIAGAVTFALAMLVSLSKAGLTPLAMVRGAVRRLRL